MLGRFLSFQSLFLLGGRRFSVEVVQRRGSGSSGMLGILFLVLGNAGIKSRRSSGGMSRRVRRIQHWKLVLMSKDRGSISRVGGLIFGFIVSVFSFDRVFHRTS